MSSCSNRGGARAGAGRKPGGGRFREPTTVKRIPQSLVPAVDQWLEQVASAHAAALPPGAQPIAPLPAHASVPLMAETVQAGFPSPAASYAAGALDFNQYLVAHPPATFALYAAGDSMTDAGIDDGDLLVVDRAREAVSGDIVIVQLATEFTVKRLRKTPAGLELHPENARVPYPILRPGGDEEWRLVGVVTFIVKHACPRSR